MLDCFSARVASQSSPSCRPVWLNEPVWTMTAMRAVAPAADEGGRHSQPAPPRGLKTMLKELAVHSCAVAQDQELTCSSLTNIPAQVPEVFQQNHDVFHCIAKVFGCIPEDGSDDTPLWGPFRPAASTVSAHSGSPNSSGAVAINITKKIDHAVHLFEVYAQAPLRLISWCSFELDRRARALVRELAILCETPTTTITELVEHIGQSHANIHTEQAATHYLAKLATVHIASRAQMPSYTTMVQHFLGTLKLPMAIYMLDYYLPMLSPNYGYNETGLTMQSAGPVREEWQPIHLSYLYQGSEFGHWKVTGGHDAFAFRHPSLAQTDVRQLLDSEAHHHKVCPIGTGRLIALVGVSSAENATAGTLSVMFGLVLGITPRTSKNKNELPAARIYTGNATPKPSK